MPKPLIFEQLVKKVAENDFVTISLNWTESLLVLEWKRQINLKERKSGFLQALELTHQYAIKYWLISDVHIFHISPEEKTWILTDWVELACKSPILKLAVVCSDNYDLLINGQDFTTQGQQLYQKKGRIEHQVFVDLDTAYTWLLSGDDKEA